MSPVDNTHVHSTQVHTHTRTHTRTRAHTRHFLAFTHAICPVKTVLAYNQVGLSLLATITVTMTTFSTSPFGASAVPPFFCCGCQRMTCASLSSHDVVLPWQQSHAHLLLASYQSQANKHNKRVSLVILYIPHNSLPHHTHRLPDIHNYACIHTLYSICAFFVSI